ncbi:MAG TPA: hypothetical protein VMV94_13300 [Phycisphaerae bacterium]|nr:hypothetical protein [Phycisphaerae bacterium]
MTKRTNSVVALATTLLVAFLVVGLVGCQQQTDKTKEAPGEKAKAPAKTEPAKPAAPAKAEPAKPTPPPPAPKPSAQATPPPAPAKTTPAIQKTTENQAKTPTDAPAASTDKRAQIEDIIYADMRVKMEQMIAQRAQLMKSGKDSSDPEVAKLEASILRAKKFLTDAGEVVGPIEPPIKEPTPPK